MKKNYLKGVLFPLMLCVFLNMFFLKTTAQVTLIENTVVTDEALFFWKANDPKPFHYGSSINPHGNCVKVVNDYVFYTWYRGGFSDRKLMVSRKKIGEGSWVHVALPGKLSLVNGKGDTHLTTNIGVCPIDGTVHIMYDHHNEDLNYIVSKKNIAFAADSEFKASNFLPQRDYLVPGKKVTGVTYPKMINNDQGEVFFERRNGAAVGGDLLVSYYNGQEWTNEVMIIKGKGRDVTQGERNFSYGKPYLFNGNFYYVYSVRWAESPTRLNEGVYIANLGARMDQTATTVDGKSYPLPIKDHTPFLIADPRSVPSTAGWSGGPEASISPKNDIYLKVSPKNTLHYNYLKTSNDTEFSEARNKGGLGEFYGNKMFKCTSSNGVLTLKSCLAGTYNWETVYTKQTGINVKKSQVLMENGKIIAIYAESKASDKVPIHCFVFDLPKAEYTPQTITFNALPTKLESDADFTLNATASSNLAVEYTSSNIDVAEIVNGNTVKIIGVGECLITASQKGNGTYDEAPEVTQTLTVNADASKTNQEIDFSFTRTTHVWGNDEIDLAATSTSGLPVEFISTDTEVAEVINGKLHVKRAGTTVIRALQPGDDTYNAAKVVSYTLTVPKKNQTITFSEIPEVVSGGASFSLDAISNNPDANLKFVCPNNQVAVVWGNQVMEILGPGTAEITVSDTGNDYFTSASKKRTITVKPKTHIVPSKMEAEYFFSKKGVNVTRWSNSIFYLNAWQAGDFVEFKIDVPEDGIYPIDIRAAAPGATKTVKVMSGTTNLATVDLTKTNNLTLFKTKSAEISLKAGVQKIKIVCVAGGFNLDWVQIKAKTGDVTPPDNGVPDYVSQKDYVISSVDAEQEDNKASNLYDGDITDESRWSAQVFSKSVVIDLLEEKNIIGTRMWTYQKRAYQYKIEVSNSPTGGFVQVVDRLNNQSTTQPIVNDFDVQRARYVKLTVTGCHNYNNNWISINELAFIFDENSNPTDISVSNNKTIDVYVSDNNLVVDAGADICNMISMYDITGELVYQKRIKQAKYSELLSLKTGVYIVKVVGNNNAIAKRVFVKK